MNRFFSSILFLAVFALCVNTGFSAFFTPRVEVVMGRFYMMNPYESSRVNKKLLGSNQKARVQIVPSANGSVDISSAFIMPTYSSWLEVINGFGVEAFWIDPKTRDYVSFSQPFGNGEIQLETGQLTEEQQKELGDDFEKAPEMSRFHGASPTVWKFKNAWEMVFFLPPEGEKALRQVLQIPETQALESLRKKFLVELIQIQSRLEDEEAKSQKSLSAQLEEGRKLVHELDSDSFQVRRLADAKLRGLGWIVIVLAGETNWSELSPEAERRLALIVQETDVLGEIEDSFHLDVQRWNNSPRIWAAALKYGTDSQKKVAWDVLAKRFPDLFEKKLKSIGLDLEADSTEVQEKIQKIYETVQEEQ